MNESTQNVINELKNQLKEAIRMADWSRERAKMFEQQIIDLKLTINGLEVKNEN